MVCHYNRKTHLKILKLVYISKYTDDTISPMSWRGLGIWGECDRKSPWGWG